MNIKIEKENSASWYHQWHNHPRHRHAHWLIFFTVLIISVSFISTDVLNQFPNSTHTKYALINEGVGGGSFSNDSDNWVIRDWDAVVPDTSYQTHLGEYTVSFTTYHDIGNDEGDWRISICLLNTGSPVVCSQVRTGTTNTPDRSETYTFTGSIDLGGDGRTYANQVRVRVETRNLDANTTVRAFGRKVEANSISANTSVPVGSNFTIATRVSQAWEGAVLSWNGVLGTDSQQMSDCGGAENCDDSIEFNCSSAGTTQFRITATGPGIGAPSSDYETIDVVCVALTPGTGDISTDRPSGCTQPCDLVVSYSTNGVSSCSITRNGSLWQNIATCSSGTYPDNNLSAGTYTYTLREGSGGSQLDSTTVVVSSGGGGGPTPTPTPVITPTPTPGITPTPTPGITPTPTPGGGTSSSGCNTNVPHPIPVLCSFDPTIARPGDTVYIRGVNLTSSINMNPFNGTAISVSGYVFGGGTSTRFVVPLGTPVGDYTLSVTGSNGTVATNNNQILTVTLVPPLVGDPPIVPLTHDIGVFAVPSASNFQDLIGSAYNYSIILVGIAVFMMITWAGFLWVTSAANPGNISTAKRYITNAIIGAVLLLSSYVILNTINPELIGGTFELEDLPEPRITNSNAISRLIATSESGAAAAITSGCLIATEIKDFTAVECLPNSASSTGLPLDPIIELTDIATNQQVGATVLQNNGNNGSGRRIVVLDTGYNRSHPDLSSSYIDGWDFVNRDNDPNDDHTGGVGSPGHGSHVAGIITADGNDPRARGVAPGAQIIAGKVLDSQGRGYWSNLVEAIYWAVNGPDGIHGTADDFNPDAISISMGGDVYNSICDTADQTTRLLSDALRYARDHGVLPIIAAGNRSNGVAIPGCLSESFTVGAVNSANAIAGFSGRGPAVDIVAPGVNIYSTLLGNAYGVKSGTSMATPVVSGIVALLKAANPGLTVNDLERAITTSACDLGTVGKDNIYGWGRITAVPGSCTSAPTPTPTPGTGTSRGNISSSFPSCTKTLSATNPNCNITVTYQATNVSLPNNLVLRANGVEIQRTNCTSASCNGTISYDDPPANTYQLTLNLASNGAMLASTNVYIYTSGTINSSFSTCNLGNTANPNCDITLTTTAPGIAPDPILIKKDGYNWRIVACSSSTCNETITDLSPAPGIHTYTLHDSSDDSRLGRVVVTVINPGPQPPLPGQHFATLCRDINYGGTCENFSSGDMDLSNNLVGTNNVSSIRGYATICTDNSLTGTCETFMMDDPNLSDNFVGNDTISSIRRGLTGGTRIMLCPDINFGGNCETITLNGDDSDLRDNAIGNDSVSSMIIETTDITACSDINYGGICQLFREGFYPDLRYHPIGDNAMSSYRD